MTGIFGYISSTQVKAAFCLLPSLQRRQESTPPSWIPTFVGMTKRYGRRTLPSLLLVAVMALTIAGCGYKVLRPAIESVRIVNLENNTTEPGLEDMLTEALAVSLQKQGIGVDRYSFNRIEGAINEFRVETVSEADEITTKYRVVIRGGFKLKGPGGLERDLAGAGKFIVTFISTGDLNEVLRNKRRAVGRLISDMAEEIAASVAYGQ